MFMFGAVTMVLCALTQLYLRRNKFSKYYLKPYSGYKKTMDATPTPGIRRNSQPEEETAMLSHTASAISTSGNETAMLNNTASGNSFSGNEWLHASNVHSCGNHESHAPRKESKFRQFINQAAANFSATQGLLIALTYVFIATFVCFPGLADDSSYDFLAGKDPKGSWYNLISILIFNAFDLTGRYIGGSPCADLKRFTVLVLSGLRTIFIVTFLLVAF